MQVRDGVSSIVFAEYDDANGCAEAETYPGTPLQRVRVLGNPAPCGRSPSPPALGVSMRIAFLGHDQPLGVHPSGGFLSRESAAWLVHNFAAERISNKVIRAFPPETAFRHLGSYAHGDGSQAITKNFGSGEITSCVFREPQSPAWQSIHGMPSRRLKIRARLMRIALGFDKPPIDFTQQPQRVNA